MIGIMTVARIIAVAPNRNTAAPTVNDLKVCMDTPASRKRKNIRATSAATATGSQWVAVMNIETAANTIEVARDTGVAAGKTNTTNAAVTAIPWAAQALSAVTTNRATTTRNVITIRAAIAPVSVTVKITADVITTTIANATATKDAAGGIARQMRSRRGLATTRPNAVAAWTNNANIVDAGRKAIAAPTNASRKT